MEPSALSRGREPLISDYAIVGDGLTAALVARDGAIDWLCHPRFDSPAVFCRLLDSEKGGYFQIAPSTPFTSTRRYLGHTNVLVTEFECASGRVRLTDCMPLGDRSIILRKLEGLAGDVPVRIDFKPTFDFARAQTSIELLPDGCRARGEGAALRLWCPGALSAREGGLQGDLRLSAGACVWAVASASEERVSDPQRLLSETIEEWTRWSDHGQYSGPWAETLRRSALLLKLLIHRPTGAMVAAPTTSLPESPGGSRNWDYRFTWLRDSSWVVSALMDLGYHDESMAFIGWLEALDLGKHPAFVMYDLDGRPRCDELELTHLRGYGGARPVRIGNAAVDQDQHDIFGEVVAAIHLCSERMPSMRPLRPGLWTLVVSLADQAAAHWEHPDHGLWEQRHPPQHYVSSRLLCWLALDRALAMAKRDHLLGPLDTWRQERDRIRATLLSDGFDARVGAFTRVIGQPALDASSLLIARNGVLPADDPRMVATVTRITEQLSAGDGLLYRYVVPDGLPGSEGAFVACSFWLALCLAQQGRVDEAHRIFEQVLARANDVGLLSEEIWPSTGALIGNYPQAFSHLALVRAAVAIERAEMSVPGAKAPR